MRLALFLTITALLPAAGWQLLSVSKIWDQPQHAAFGDLIRWNNQWFAVFREGLTHAPSKGKPDDGKLRVLSSPNGENWTSQALIAEAGVDLRDPHLSLTPQNQLRDVPPALDPGALAPDRGIQQRARHDPAITAHASTLRSRRPSWPSSRRWRDAKTSPCTWCCWRPSRCC